jgi:Arc/MetJ-type ribon-helix-helix transcriptional regulator
MDQKKEPTTRVTVTIPEKDVKFYELIVREKALGGERISTSELVRDAVADHIRKLRRRR